MDQSQETQLAPGQGLPAPLCSPASVCDCQSWCQTGGKIIAAHHRNCRHYDLEGDCHRIITDLLRGIEASAADTDGVHPALWEAYKRGKASVWEFDWKEEDDPRPIQYTGHVPCRKCGQTHWMHGPCPENTQEVAGEALPPSTGSPSPNHQKPTE